jgi:hypothetical protein
MADGYLPGQHDQLHHRGVAVPLPERRPGLVDPGVASSWSTFSISRRSPERPVMRAAGEPGDLRVPWARKRPPKTFSASGGGGGEPSSRRHERLSVAVRHGDQHLGHLSRRVLDWL